MRYLFNNNAKQLIIPIDNDFFVKRSYIINKTFAKHDCVTVYLKKESMYIIVSF